ncbi:hypothetical protein T4A_5814 [Trichinella pseudospiralis]|uniref:Farnesylated proteins-converting enzyme 2 n=1 Tax=Trichinella pseudospiralis TaxID=6337 RepID=A0A0V1EM13_TRIPS|nr:hypothetical protein T4A_5814 [Trichinella pseudospiralis]
MQCFSFSAVFLNQGGCMKFPISICNLAALEIFAAFSYLSSVNVSSHSQIVSSEFFIVLRNVLLVTCIAPLCEEMAFYCGMLGVAASCYEINVNYYVLMISKSLSLHYLCKEHSIF